MSPFLRLLAKIEGADLRPEQFSEEAAKRLRREQLRGTIEQMRLMLLCNTFFAPALSIQAWNSGINGLVLLWTASILLFSWWLFFSWRNTYETTGHAHDMHIFVRETFVNSLFWAVGIALFYPVVEGDQKVIVATIMAGSLAIGTVGFSRAPSAAFTYLSVQTISNTAVVFICGLLRDSSTDYMLAFLSLTAGASVFSAVLERGKASIIAFKNREQLSEKSEVIDLLLKDYEEQATEWLWQTNADGKITRAPTQIVEMLGETSQTATQLPLTKMIAAKSMEQNPDVINRLLFAFEERTEFHDIKFSILDPEKGDTRWILMKGRPQFSSGEFSGFRGLFADATHSVAAERKVQFLAAYDSLTELLNRNSVQKCLMDLNPKTDFAAAFLIDLDGFKQVNDSYGHHIGDCLLQSAADRLRHSPSSDWIAARLGGDEFFVLITRKEPIGATEISCFADGIVDRLSKPYQAERFNIQLSTSVGVAQFPRDTETGHDLLSLADLALYEAKNNGRNRYEFFDVSLQDVLTERIAITKRLKSAVRHGSLRPHYQSQHALSDGRLIGFESLARWFDDELGHVGPNIFIPIAEQTGLIVELGEQLLRHACCDGLEWFKILGDQAPVISVNFSPVQFSRTDVTALVARTLKDTGLPARLLEVEITEGVLISNKEKIASTLRELSDMGVSIALDDFGTGYSSLSYLKELPLDRLKIDRSFVCDLREETANSIVETVIQLGHSLGLEVIAEGVEEQSQADVLHLLGCDDGQGYLFGKPMPYEQANAYVVSKAKGPKAITGT